jgi:hypothetical protein
MNAKIAKVNLLIEDEVTPFDKYDKGNDSNLTRGALWAQIRRFYELWSSQIYIERKAWESLSATAQQHLSAVLEQFYFHMGPNRGLEIARMQVEASVEVVQSENEQQAAQKKSTLPQLDKFETFVFPSGMNFRSD